MSDLNIYADQTAIDALTPITGDVVLRASDNAVLLYNGSAWKEFQPDAGPYVYSNTYSLAFDGTNEKMQAGDSTTLASASAFTISWILSPNWALICPVTLPAVSNMATLSNSTPLCCSIAVITPKDSNFISSTD